MTRDTDGVWDNDEHSLPTISGDGRYVVYFALEYYSGYANGTNSYNQTVAYNYDIYISDTVLGGVTRLTTGEDSYNSRDYITPSISENGQYLAYIRFPDNYGSSSFQNPELYKHSILVENLATGEVEHLPQQNRRVPAFPASAYLCYPQVSNDGRYVVFWTTAENLVVGQAAASGYSGIFRKDLQTGQLLLVSSDPRGR